jgi:hypothetical protein
VIFILISDKVTIRITSGMCKYYKEKGYTFKCNDFIEVKVSDLPNKSHAKVLVKCDKCGKEYLLSYSDYNKKKNGDYCCGCKYESIKITNLKKYGCENVYQVPHIRERQKNTVIEKYGCENVFQSEEIKEKSRESFLKKYDVIHPMKNKEFAQIIHKKSSSSMYINGTQSCSKQQKYLNELFGGELNKLYDNLWLDIYFEADKIYIEYNGSGHDISVKYKKISNEDFRIQEIKRYKFLKSCGLKQMVISSFKDILPNEDILCNMKDYAFYILRENISDWIVFDIDKNEVRFKDNKIEYNFNTPIVFNKDILRND